MPSVFRLTPEASIIELKPMPGPEPLIDRKLLRTRRARAARHAGNRDYLLTRAADDLADRLSLIRRRFPVAAVVGDHGGALARRLRATGAIDTLIDIEGSDCLLAQSDEPSVVADEEALPLAPQSCDVIASALVLHLVNDLPGTLIQIRRALKPDGLFLAAMLGAETLRELREAWIIAETELHGGASPRVLPFADVRTLGNLLSRADFALPVADSDLVTVTFASPLELMHDVKAMGASNMMVARSRRPASRGLVLRASAIYAERNTNAAGRFSATFEIVSLTAWAPHKSQQQPLQPGSATTRLADALKVRPVSSPKDPV